MAGGAAPLFGRADRLNKLAAEMGETRAEVLGRIPGDAPILDPAPATTSASWVGSAGAVDLEEGPPPWEQESGEYLPSDARRYVDVPTNWTLRWINPRLLESDGWRYWQPVTKGHPGVTVRVSQMAAVDGTIRRGGASGDILAWMYTSWVVSRREMVARATAIQSQKALHRQQALREEMLQGMYGPHVRLDTSTTPTHTMAEGRSLRNDP